MLFKVMTLTSYIKNKIIENRSSHFYFYNKCLLEYILMVLRCADGRASGRACVRAYVRAFRTVYIYINIQLVYICINEQCIFLKF